MRGSFRPRWIPHHISPPSGLTVARLFSRGSWIPVAGCRRSTLSSRHGTIPQALHAATQSTAVVSLLSGCSPHLRNFLRLGSCGVQLETEVAIRVG